MKSFVWVGTRVTLPLAEELRRLARQRERSVSAELRLAIQRHLEISGRIKNEPATVEHRA